MPSSNLSPVHAGNLRYKDHTGCEESFFLAVYQPPVQQHFTQTTPDQAQKELSALHSTKQGRKGQIKHMPD